MADKDIGEQDIIKLCLPNTSVIICLLRSFRREVTCEEMGITSGQRSMCLELIQKMAHASSEAEYNSLHAQFQCDAPTEVVTSMPTGIPLRVNGCLA